jgi:exonuclease III
VSVDNNSLSLYSINLFNARSLKNKFCELHCHLNKDNPDIVCITETWLHSSTPDSAVISESNFSPFRKDRPNDREGGGVCILINNATTEAVHFNVPTKYESLELVVIDIVSTASCFRLFVAYRPPSSSDYDPVSLSFTSLLCECIESLIPLNSTFVLCGDFNFPKITWSNDHNILTNVNSCSGIFLNLYYKHVLTQFITHPTRYSGSTRMAQY